MCSGRTGKNMLRTHLYKFHKEYAKTTDFHGYEMPLWYEGIISEHLAVRNAVGIFDITHMGRGIITGPEASKFSNHIFTYDVAKIARSRAWITSMCDEKGVIIDDMMVYRLSKEKYFIVFNCGYKEKNRIWISKQSKDFDIQVKYISEETPQFALQGPEAANTLQKITCTNVSELDWFECTWDKIDDIDVFISRTGYTGEDGFEIYVWNTPISKTEKASKIWRSILYAGEEYGIKPCGLGARDTTRLEAGFWLEDNECDELNVTPLELGLKWAVSLEKRSFIGKGALLKQLIDGINRKRVGIRMLEKGIPRKGNQVYVGSNKIGQVTSGTFSPILKSGIAMAYIPPENSGKGSKISVKIRDKLVNGEIVKFPFYDRNCFGRLRGSG
jgi:aminomethyltransferase